ncbi:MAG: hypothetical protein OEY75_09300 [Hylemonella sp.]|nr:hypothetical protein [Hylemonella sp.]MDH5709296.1 hypothetical protein [Hylemonella sp.]
MAYAGAMLSCRPRPMSPPARPSRLARCAIVLGAGLLALLSQAGEPPAASAQRLSLSCPVLYAPRQSTWQRTVVVTHDGQRVRSVLIDGQSPYAFSVHGQLLSTALDNEQIRVDLAQGQWQSDFRGLAAGQGRCEFLP